MNDDNIANSQKSKKIQGFAQFVANDLLSSSDAAQITSAEPLLEASITAEMAQLLPKDKQEFGQDPIALQFVPSIQEIEIDNASLEDPLGDQLHSPLKGIVHRHKDRCLLMPVSVCALYCRFCFRKEQIGPGHKALSQTELDAALDYIARTPDLFEVILSGGDPFMMKPKTLQYIFDRLKSIEHVKVIRIHTRIPVVDSKRVTKAMLEVCQSVKPLYIVLHINHAKELHADAKQCIAQLQQAGIHLLSQSVLLKGINDTIESLEQLMRALVIFGVKPYYIHQLDPARGVDHFRVERQRGLQLMQQLREQCSGLCQPLYVEDVPQGAGAKMPVKQGKGIDNTNRDQTQKTSEKVSV